MGLLEYISLAGKDEHKEYLKYTGWARAAEEQGMRETAELLRGIAADELRHSELLQGLSVRLEPAEVWRKPLHHYPETYGDWTNLAIDIKEKDPASAPTVNDRLNVILYEEGDVDAAKRWLVERGGELGIT